MASNIRFDRNYYRQRAAVSGIEISFWDYFRVGGPLTVISLAIGTL
jgi:Na+/H+ antiporter NhaD/arsenite permease-like protein